MKDKIEYNDRLQMVSDFVDAESSDFDINIILQDKRLQDKWQNYNLIGDVMRNNTPQFMHTSILDKVQQQLEQEPVIFAPAFARKAKKPLVQNRMLALAASVAAIVAVSTLWMISDKDSDRFETHMVVENGRQIERLSDPRLDAYVNRHYDAMTVTAVHEENSVATEHSRE